MIPFEIEYFWKSFPQLIVYLPRTFAVVLFSLAVGFVFSFLLVLMKLSRKPPLQAVANGYTTVMRCTPSIIMLFLVYYGLPKLILPFGVDLNEWDSFFFVVVTFALMSGGTLSEVMRSAYESIPKGQLEAAYSVGLTLPQALRRIVVPQAFVVALPNLGNSIIELLKSGALAFTIGFVDIMGQANLVISRRFGTYQMETYLMLALIYWCVCIVLEKIMKRLEEGAKNRKMKLAKVVKE